MLTVENAQIILDQIVNDLAQMRNPGHLVHASEALRWAFCGCRIRREFLEVLQHRVKIVSWGSVRVEELPVLDALLPAKGPGVYLNLVSLDSNCQIKFHFGPYDTPVRFIKD